MSTHQVVWCSLVADTVVYQWFSHREDVFQYGHEYSHWTPVRWYIKYQIYMYQVSEISSIIHSTTFLLKTAQKPPCRQQENTNNKPANSQAKSFLIWRNYKKLTRNLLHNLQKPVKTSTAKLQKILRINLRQHEWNETYSVSKVCNS